MTQTNVKIKIKLFDKSLPFPKKHSAGAACFDLYARLDSVIAPRSIGYIPLNVAIEVPEGYWVLLAARSSTHKYGLIPANGIGIVDEDYKGDNDEYILIVYNITDQEVTIPKATRIAQMTVMPRLTVETEQVPQLSSVDRGGLGSTGAR